MSESDQDRPDFDALLFDVTFAIAKSIHTPKKFLMEDAEPLAKEFIAHLRRSRWRIEREPPIGGHGGGKG
jgi:hypothetical protein